MNKVWNKEVETMTQFVDRLSKETGKSVLPIKVNGKVKNVEVINGMLYYKKRVNSRWAYGFREDIESMELIESKSKEELFIKGLTTVLKYLTKSGLWDNIQRDIKTMLSLGYEGSKDREDLRSTFYMFECGAKIVPIYFNKWDTESKRQQIQDAYKSKTSLSLFGRNGYDISFEYNSKLNKAWYSKEYKGCGNGHYYLALDDRHALFCEDD